MNKNHIAIIGILSLIALFGAFIYIGCGGSSSSASGSSGTPTNSPPVLTAIGAKSAT